MEDIESNTVANKLADLVVQLEKDNINYRETQVNDEEGMYYSDDEDRVLLNDEEENTQEISNENQTQCVSVVCDEKTSFLTRDGKSCFKPDCNEQEIILPT